MLTVAADTISTVASVARACKAALSVCTCCLCVTVVATSISTLVDIFSEKKVKRRFEKPRIKKLYPEHTETLKSITVSHLQMGKRGVLE